jgi:hypothetical protein
VAVSPGTAAVLLLDCADVRTSLLKSAKTGLRCG